MGSAVFDRYVGGQALPDQAGDGSVKLFSFEDPVDLIWVRCDGGNGRVDPFGGEPSTEVGIFCEDGVPQPLTISTSKIRVFALTGVVIRVWGFRYEI